MAYSPDDSYSSNTGLMPDAELVLIIDDEPQIRRAVRDASARGLLPQGPSA